MLLAAVVHRIATDPQFAARVQTDPGEGLKAAGVAIDSGELAALRSALNAGSDVGAPERPALRPMMTVYDRWPTEFDVYLYERSHELWAGVLEDQAFGCLMDQALPRPFATPALPWNDLPGLCCQAAGGQARLAGAISLAWSLLAAACHLLDDIADGDRPDAWWAGVGAGVGAYVAAGLATNAWQVLSGPQMEALPGATRRAVLADFHKTYLEVCAGQYRDLVKVEPTLAECWQIVELKSARYYALACRAGARLATDDSAALARFGAFGHHLGLLLQLANDVSGVWRAQGPGSDLAAGRRWSLPVAYTMSVAPADVQSRLRECLKRAPVEPGAEAEARALVETSGAGLYLAAEAIRYQREAERILEQLDPPAPVREALAAILASVSPRPEQGAGCHERLHAQTLVE